MEIKVIKTVEYIYEVEDEKDLPKDWDEMDENAKSDWLEENQYNTDLSVSLVDEEEASVDDVYEL